MVRVLLFVSVLAVLICIGVVVATVVASRRDGEKPNRLPPIPGPGRPGGKSGPADDERF